jgi:hypothetical protein
MTLVIPKMFALILFINNCMTDMLYKHIIQRIKKTKY